MEKYFRSLLKDSSKYLIKFLEIKNSFNDSNPVNDSKCKISI